MKLVYQVGGSSNIAGPLEFDDATEELLVPFTSGAVYKYSGVPKEVVEQVVRAGSVGSAFNALIKQGGYGYERVI